MTEELVAAFTKRFRSGVRIEGHVRMRASGFSCTVLFGPSGCGKTTILRCLAGLERPDAGSVRFGSEVWSDADQRLFLAPRARRVGFVFQDYALFPHLTVADNIGYGLFGLSRAEWRARVAEMLDRLGLAGLGDRSPGQISGGQQQRVALGRSLARQPRLLLLDEPLSALDAPLRDDVRRNLRGVLESFDIPTVLVTHDRLEARTLADQVVLVDDGRVVQAGTVEQVFARPASLAAAKIVGFETVVDGETVGASDGAVRIRVGSAELTAAGPASAHVAVVACIRADDVALSRAGEDVPPASNVLRGRVLALRDDGTSIRVELDCGFGLVAAISRRELQRAAIAVGDPVTAWLSYEAVHVIPRAEKMSSQILVPSAELKYN